MGCERDARDSHLEQEAVIQIVDECAVVLLDDQFGALRPYEEPHDALAQVLIPDQLKIPGALQIGVRSAGDLQRFPGTERCEHQLDLSVFGRRIVDIEHCIND